MKNEFIYNRKKAVGKKGGSLIQLRIYIDGKYKYYNTGVYINPSEWNEAKKRIKVRTSSDEKKNLVLDLIIKNITDLETNNRINDRKTTFEQVKNALKGETRTLFIDYCKTILKNEILSSSTKDNINATLYLLERYEVSVNKKLELMDINFSLLQNFEAYCIARKMKTNSIKRHHSVIKKYLRHAVNNELITSRKNGYNNYTIKSELTNIEHLEAQELEIVENTRSLIEDSNQKIALDLFLISCYTGLRYSDVIGLKKSDLIEINGSYYLAKNTEKTGVKVKLNISLLMNGKALIIIQRYINDSKNEEIFKQYSFTNQKVNYYLKKITIALYVKKRLHFHMARHTFSCILLENGFDLIDIQKLLGHTEIKTTSIYAKVSDSRINDKLELMNN